MIPRNILWKRVHNHDSIENPELLKEYKEIVFERMQYIAELFEKDIKIKYRKNVKIKLIGEKEILLHHKIKN